MLTHCSKPYSVSRTLGGKTTIGLPSMSQHIIDLSGTIPVNEKQKILFSCATGKRFAWNISSNVPPARNFPIIFTSAFLSMDKSCYY